MATVPIYMEDSARIGPAMGAELMHEDTGLTFSQATMGQIADDTGGTACPVPTIFPAARRRRTSMTRRTTRNANIRRG